VGRVDAAQTRVGALASPHGAKHVKEREQHQAGGGGLLGGNDNANLHDGAKVVHMWGKGKASLLVLLMCACVAWGQEEARGRLSRRLQVVDNEDSLRYGSGGLAACKPFQWGAT